MKRRWVQAVLALFALGTLTAAAISAEPLEIATTYPSPDGNRYLDVALDLRSAERTVVDLPGEPQWIAGAASDAGVTLLAVLSDGRTFRVRLAHGQAARSELLYRGSTAPPLAVVERNGSDGLPALRPLDPDAYAANSWTTPYPLSGPGGAGTRRLVITPDGKLDLSRDSETTTLSSRALPDSRIVRADDDRFLLLGRASTEYTHGILGDNREATGIILVELTDGSTPLVFQRPLRTSGVVETLIPLVANVLPDAPVEVVLPLSTHSGGTRIVLTDITGRVLAEGPPIGRRFRWRHPLAVGPFGPAGETEIAVTRTPHIGGSLEYYRPRGDELELVHSRKGYSTHRMGSRNLDAAVAADFTGNGRADVLVPTRSYRSLAVVERSASGSREELTIELAAELTTNLALLPYGATAALAAGLGDSSIVVWTPE